MVNYFVLQMIKFIKYKNNMIQTEPKKRKQPARIDLTLSQSLLNLSILIPLAYLLNGCMTKMTYDVQHKRNIELENIKLKNNFKIESLRIVNQKFDTIKIQNQIKLNKSELENDLLKLQIQLEQTKNKILKYEKR